MHFKFVSEPIRPAPGTADAQAMASGAPGLPREFTWRGRPLRIEKVLRTWRDTGPCKHGKTESYVRKHWFEVETPAREVARIYFERRPRGGGKLARWWLFSISAGHSEAERDLRGSKISATPNKMTAPPAKARADGSSCSHTQAIAVTNSGCKNKKLATIPAGSLDSA